MMDGLSPRPSGLPRGRSVPRLPRRAHGRPIAPKAQQEHMLGTGHPSTAHAVADPHVHARSDAFPLYSLEVLHASNDGRIIAGCFSIHHHSQQSYDY